MSLREQIEAEIRDRGAIPFSRYMELCLYHPELGYYSRPAEQFGKAGDFYTSSDIHAVFGRLLARQFDEMWRAFGSPARIEILELGPGRGLFAQDVLDWSAKKFPAFFQAFHYSLLEQSSVLRQRLNKRLESHLATGKASLCEAGVTATAFVEEISNDSPILIFANEFFDAMPVEIMSEQGSLRINSNGGRLAEGWAPSSTAELDFLDHYGVHPEPSERVEAPLIAQQYMADLSAALRQGIILAIDYGYTRAELLAGRHRGTLTAYRNHSISASAYEAPGEQDLTTHVNFTALAAAAQRRGGHAHPLLTQSQFLLGIGEPNQFADAFEECRLPQERAKVSLQLKHLVTPAGIGETFHVLLTSRGIDPTKISALTGMSFGRRQT